MAEMTKIVEVVPYDPRWKEAFVRIREKIRSLIGDLIVKIEHVGSTSVEGLRAKPIIDLDAVVSDWTLFPEIAARLEGAGYVYQGTLGVEGREAFHPTVADGLMRYNFYVCPEDGKGYLEHLALRDYLRSHPQACREYAELKEMLAARHRYDIDAYCDGKTAFIRSVLAQTLYREKGAAG